MDGAPQDAWLQEALDYDAFASIVLTSSPSADPEPCQCPEHAPKTTPTK